MRFEKTRLIAMGHLLPPRVVTSAQLEERLAPVYSRLKLPAGRLEMMSGIRERRFWNPGSTPSSVAMEAARKALAASDVPVEKIGALFHTSVCRDFLEPATASVEHNGLGLPPRCLNFDISNACLGALNGVIALASLIELGAVEAGLVVAGEMGEALVESTVNSLVNDPSVTRQTIKPAFASLTIGSGAVALLLGSKKLADGHKIVGGVARADTRGSHLCTSPQDTGFGSGAAPLMETDSEELMKAGCALAAETWKDFTGEMGWSVDDVDKSFTHQVGAAHRRLLYQSIGLDMAKDFPTLEFLGNVGSVSLPITLAIGAERGILNKGDKAALMGIGSGLNCVMLGLEW